MAPLKAANAIALPKAVCGPVFRARMPPAKKPPATGFTMSFFARKLSMQHSMPEYRAPTFPKPRPLLYMLRPVCIKNSLVLCIDVAGSGGGGGGKFLKYSPRGSLDRIEPVLGPAECDVGVALDGAAAARGSGAVAAPRAGAPARAAAGEPDPAAPLAALSRRLAFSNAAR